jgi:imidazolonepropionase-like amidohydrolase
MREILALLLFILLPTSLVAQSRLTVESRPVVFNRVTVIDMTGAPPKPSMTVIVVGSRISALGTTGKVRLPKNAQIIDASGKYLIPGLWDMHTHLSFAGETVFPVLIANGITGVRDMGGDLNQIDGWRREIMNGMRLGSYIVRAGSFVDGVKPEAKYRLTVTNEAEAKQAVRTLKQQGVDFIKIHNALSRDAFFALASEARKQKIPLAVHLPRGVSAAEASDAGAKSLEHIEILLESALYRQGATAKTLKEAYEENTGEKGTALFARFVKNKTYYVPTLVAYRAFVRAGEDEQSIAGRKALFQRFIELVGAMNRAGVGIMAGSDFADKEAGIQPGFDLHDELALFVEAGITPMQALQSATSKPTGFLGLSNSLGTIERGKIANLVLLEANPLDNIGNTRKISAVMVNGRYLSKEKLQEMLPSKEQR